MSKLQLVREIKGALAERNRELECLAVWLSGDETIELAGAVESSALRELAVETAQAAAKGLPVKDQIYVVNLVPSEEFPQASSPIPMQL
ncbi:MAG: hypothetical protein SFU86_07260 [Pirellulaceae bacterium]|nr:hypothetical protein [Pirellulaceae bacterium]